MTAFILLIACLSAVPAPGDEPASALSPEAQPYNNRGIAHIEAGAHAAGVHELERAYALMPDPLIYRAGRSKVLGSMRSALNHLYQSTGDPAHLHRLQGHLLRHLEVLLLALGETATTADTAGSLAALREVEERLARAAPASPAVPAAGPVDPPRPTATRPPPVTAPIAAPVGDRPRSTDPRLRWASGAVLGVGFASLGVMTYAVVVHADSRRKLQTLTNTIVDAGAPQSPAQRDEGERLFRRSRDHRTLGIMTGITAGTAIITSVVLLAIGRRQAHRAARVAPAVAPGFAGLDLHLEF